MKSQVVGKVPISVFKNLCLHVYCLLNAVTANVGGYVTMLIYKSKATAYAYEKRVSLSTVHRYGARCPFVFHSDYNFLGG